MKKYDIKNILYKLTSVIFTEKNSHKTSKDKIYTAGDVHIGQSLVVRAIREGRDCAKEVDFDLMGYTNL